MKRRFLLKNGLLALPLLTGCTMPMNLRRPAEPALIKPKRLRKGSIVRLVAPGGPVTDAKVEKAVTNLESLGLQVQTSKNLLARNGHNAGTDAQRIADLHAAFQDRRVEAVWAIRGGDGCSKLLPSLDFSMIHRNPKVLIGFSDITALLQANYQSAQLLGFHGPIGYWPLTDYNNASLQAALFEGRDQYTIQGKENTEALVKGRATGRLVGGNLSLLAAMCGTPYGLDARGKIVFIEDVGEAPRHIDRMLTQLRQAAYLDQAAGIVLGEFLDCDCDRQTDDPSQCAGNSLTLREVLLDRLGGLGIPILYNFPFGHDENLCTFPVGVRAEMDAEAGTVRWLEAAVV